MLYFDMHMNTAIIIAKLKTVYWINLSHVKRNGLQVL